MNGDADIRHSDKSPARIRTFETGATRDQDATKQNFEGYWSVLVARAFGQYMTKHRVQADGSLRAPDNWQKGIPLQSYMDSIERHLNDLKLHHRGYSRLAREGIDDALAGLFFNVQGYWHETLKRALIDEIEGVDVTRGPGLG